MFKIVYMYCACVPYCMESGIGGDIGMGMNVGIGINIGMGMGIVLGIGTRMGIGIGIGIDLGISIAAIPQGLGETSCSINSTKPILRRGGRNHGIARRRRRRRGREKKAGDLLSSLPYNLNKLISMLRGIGFRMCT